LAYDVIIIGAGMSGLAAGIRLAYFDKKVCIVEKHHQIGGLNSFYRLDGRRFDVGLHALTNFVPKGVKNTPLPKLLRQLRIPRDELDLHEQNVSQIRFPHARLRFSNDIALLTGDIADLFPRQVDGFRRLVNDLRTYDDIHHTAEPRSTRKVLTDYIRDPTLVDMLLCPVMYYGSAEENDMDFARFSIIFRSIFCEGLARPRLGVRRIIRSLVRRYRACGGDLRMRCGVIRLNIERERVAGVALESGEAIEAPIVLSSAGYFETMGLCSDSSAHPEPDRPGRLSFMESINILDTKPAELGHDTTIMFFNDAASFAYERSRGLIDDRSGVICCPNNFEGHKDMSEGIIRFTSLANYDRWTALPQDEYAAAKKQCHAQVVERALRFLPDFRDRVVYTDVFTPRTVKQYTGRLGGAVYGATRKRWDGRTRLKNLFICGTDQGYLGIIGALLSGITMANLHVLSDE